MDQYVAHQEGTAPPGALCGNLERCDATRVVGWARSGVDTNPVAIEVLDGDTVLARVSADQFRADLLEAGIGDGRFSFDVVLPRPLSPLVAHEIAVRRVLDGAHLPRSPCHIPQSTAFDPSMRTTLGRVLANVASLADRPGALDTVIAFLDEQQDRLRQARAELAAPRHDDQPAYLAVEPALRALFIDEAVPDASRDAGSAALLSHMRSAVRLGFHVVLMAGPRLPRRGALEDALQAEAIECLCSPQDTSVEDALCRRAGRFDVVYFHRLTTLQRYGALVTHYMPQARKVFSLADLQSLRLERQGAVEGRSELAPLARSLRQQELAAAASVDAVVTHSTVEAELLRRELPSNLVHAVPWSVPCRPVRATFTERRDLAFVGSYAHEPNLDAVHHLVRDIMPLVWARAPHIRALLVGSGMPGSVRALAGPRVVVLGQVGRLADVFELVRLTVAPLRFGAGIKGKVMDSLAAGVPCACSPVAAEGLDLPQIPGLVGWTVDALAHSIIDLHEDEAVNLLASRRGLDYAAEALDDAKIDALLRPVLGFTASTRASR